MRHTVEIADSDGNTMQLSVYVDTTDWGGSWYSLTKGGIRYHNGAISQSKRDWGSGIEVDIIHGRYMGIQLWNFVSWGTVNDQGTGWLQQSWVIGLKPGAIDWSLV